MWFAHVRLSVLGVASTLNPVPTLYDTIWAIFSQLFLVIYINENLKHYGPVLLKDTIVVQ